MRTMVDDERFKTIARDHRFRPIYRKQRKVKIDERFQSMFTDPAFKTDYATDKRGKPIFESNSENLKKYYRLSKKEQRRIKEREKKRKALLFLEDDDDKNPHDENLEVVGVESDIVEFTQTDVVRAEDASFSSSSDEEDDDESTDEDEGPDLARGEGNVESSSDEDEEEDEEFYAEESAVFDHKWSELDVDAPRVADDEISSRLALCNMDWDRIKASDLFVLFNSFKPQEGQVKRVSVFPSEFGKQRMQEEEVNGPAEFRQPLDDKLQSSDAKEGEKYHVEKLRQYQLNRLKYFYAVIECDTKETADAIYNECDGMEFETSSAKLDLRFVPDDVTFDDDTPREVADSLPDKDLYKPSQFVTAALNQSKVDLTWDETDKNRLSLTMKKFKEEDLDAMDMHDFLASSSGGDDSDGADDDADDRGGGGGFPVLSRTSNADQIERYRSLLLGNLDDDDDNKENDGVHMEITWQPDLTTAAQDDKEETSTIEEEEEDSKPDDKEEEEVDERKSRAELELLMADDEADPEKKKTHFNIDSILKEQEKSRKRKRKRGVKKEEGEEEEDRFKIDVDDERFSAIFSSSDFALDPNNPNFKKTDAMQRLLSERRDRVARQPLDGAGEPRRAQEAAKPATAAAVSSLIRSIKSKTMKRSGDTASGVAKSRRK